MKLATLLLVPLILACATVPLTEALVSNTAVSPIAETVPATESVEVVTPATDVYLRSCPSLNCRPLDWTWAGEPIRAICDGDWCRVADTEMYFCLPAALLAGGCE